MENLMHQCVLKSGNATMVCWLSDDKKFKVGDSVTLKDSSDPTEKWKVMSKGKGHPRSDIKRVWDNDLKRDSSRKKIGK